MSQAPKDQLCAAPAALPRPSRTEAEEAIRTLLRWAGDDPTREGLADTPARVARAYEDWFSGYAEDPHEYLLRTFEEVEGYDEMIVLKDIRFESHCEHHLAPIIGRAHIGYLPGERLLGLSKLARVVTHFSRRLQVQERLTTQVADWLAAALHPKGVGVVLEAEHACMSLRGVRAAGSMTLTSALAGIVRDDERTRAEFFSLVGYRP